MQNISGKRVAILATHGFEQSELEVPLKKLREAGATVDVVSLKSGEITGWDKKDWGRAVPVDKTLDEASPADYDALVLPGGQMNPDLLRVEQKALDFIKSFWNDSKVIGAICHAPWLLVETRRAGGPPRHLLQVDQDRRHECRRRLGGRGSRRRPGPGHQPQSERSRRPSAPSWSRKSARVATSAAPPDRRHHPREKRPLRGRFFCNRPCRISTIIGCIGS